MEVLAASWGQIGAAPVSFPMEDTFPRLVGASSHPERCLLKQRAQGRPESQRFAASRQLMHWNGSRFQNSVSVRAAPSKTIGLPTATLTFRDCPEPAFVSGGSGRIGPPLLSDMLLIGVPSNITGHLTSVSQAYRNCFAKNLNSPSCERESSRQLFC